MSTHMHSCNFVLASREAAFVHAIVTAGTMHTLSRACMESKLDSYCACGQGKAPEDLPETHYWRGCSDNLQYGYSFSRTFVDAAEAADDGLTTANLNVVSRVLMNLHNNEAGRIVSESFQLFRPYLYSKILSVSFLS